MNKNFEGNIDVIKTVNLLYHNGSLSNDIIHIFDMYLQPYVWCSGEGVIGLSDTNEMCTYMIKQHL